MQVKHMKHRGLERWILTDCSDEDVAAMSYSSIVHRNNKWYVAVPKKGDSYIYNDFDCIIIGVLHREGGPALVNADTPEYYCERWFRNGVSHRDGGPAYIGIDYECWYREGQIHREGGPALIDGEVRTWYWEDKIHREDGPAYEAKDGDKYFYHGKLLDCKTMEEFERLKRLKAFW